MSSSRSSQEIERLSCSNASHLGARFLFSLDSVCTAFESQEYIYIYICIRNYTASMLVISTLAAYHEWKWRSRTSTRGWERDYLTSGTRQSPGKSRALFQGRREELNNKCAHLLSSVDSVGRRFYVIASFACLRSVSSNWHCHERERRGVRARMPEGRFIHVIIHQKKKNWQRRRSDESIDNAVLKQSEQREDFRHDHARRGRKLSWLTQMLMKSLNM